MTTFIFDDINLVPFLTEYNLQLSPQTGDNSFTDINGETVSDRLGDKLSVSFSLRRVDGTTAISISNAVNSGEVDVICSAPSQISTRCRVVSYKAIPYMKSTLWNFDITIESAALINRGGGL